MYKFFKNIILIFFTTFSFLSCSKQSPTELIKKAEISAENKDWKRVVDYASSAVSMKSENIRYNSLLALAYMHLGRPEKAIDLLKAFDKSSNFNILTIYASALRMAHQNQKAFDLFMQIYSIKPNNLYVLKSIAIISLDLKIKKGIVFLKKLVNEENQSLLYNNLGVLYEQQYKHKSAIQMLFYALSLSSRKAEDKPIISLNLAIVYDEIKLKRKAISFYNLFLEKSKDDVPKNVRNSVVQRLDFLRNLLKMQKNK